MKTALLITYFVAILLWVKLLSAVFELGMGTMNILSAFVFAPFLEEWIFRYLPVRFGQKWKISDEMMWISTLIFAFIHMKNYMYFGMPLCLLVQGVLGLILWRIMKRYGYIYAVVFHAAYNAGVFYILTL